MKYKSDQTGASSTADVVEVDGKVTEVLPDTRYVVEIEIGGIKHSLIAYPSGRIRKHYIKILIGDDVRVEITPKYDIDKGRIVWKKTEKRDMPVAA